MKLSFLFQYSKLNFTVEDVVIHRKWYLSYSFKGEKYYPGIENKNGVYIVWNFSYRTECIFTISLNGKQYISVEETVFNAVPENSLKLDYLNLEIPKHINLIRATLLLDLKLKMNLVSLNILHGELIGISSLEREQIMLV